MEDREWQGRPQLPRDPRSSILDPQGFIIRSEPNTTMSPVRVMLFAGLVAALAAWPRGLRGDDQANAADEATLRGAGIQTTGPALLEFFRLRTPSDQKRQRL